MTICDVEAPEIPAVDPEAPDVLPERLPEREPETETDPVRA